MKTTRWHSCNVLHVGADARQLWQFDAKGGGFVLDRTQTLTAGQSLPAQWVAKDWRTLWQRKLNVAWLRPASVFLRVAHFPAASLEETRAMVELQLEKLSPLPLTHMVWSFHVLPETVDQQQAVVVLIVARDVVEEFLGELEEQGFLADRLELGVLDQLKATEIQEDGAYIYAGVNGPRDTAIVAWWSGGLLRNLSLLNLPVTGDRAAQLRQQLVQPAWAGELEGWLTANPAWHLIADEAVARDWEPLLRQAMDAPIRLTAPLTAAALAERTAQRAAQTDALSNLLPPDFSKRYEQQFFDRLWMRVLFALGALYLLGTLVYFGALGWAEYQKGSVDRIVAGLSDNYTNALQIKARYQVLKDRQELKYAALDCWQLVAEFLPDGARLQSIDVMDGRKLVLNGDCPVDKVMEVIEFSGALRKAKVRDQAMFDPLGGDQFTQNSTPGATVVRWSFGLDLNRTEEKVK